MRDIDIELLIQWVSFRIEQISNYYVSIRISSTYHRVISVETDTSIAQEWLFINFLRTFCHHVDYNQVASEEPLKRALRCDESYLR